MSRLPNAIIIHKMECDMTRIHQMGWYTGAEILHNVHFSTNVQLCTNC